MVTTRAQYRKSASANPENRRRSSTSSTASSLSKSGKAQQEAHTTIIDEDTPPRTKSRVVSALQLELPGTDPNEHLGRGCRQHRQVVTLDEQYLSQAMAKPSPSSALHGKRGSGGPHSVETPDKFIIHHRYPERDAARRALSNLQDTLHEMDRTGNTSSSSSDEEEAGDDSATSSSSASGQGQREGSFHFRHHPEVARHLGRRHHRAGSSGNNSSGSRSSSSASGSSSSSSGDDGDDNRGASDLRSQARNGNTRSGRGGAHNTGRARTSGASMDSGALMSPRGGPVAGQKRARSSGSVTDLSISDDSVREDSIENLAQKDAKLAHDEDGTDDGVSDEDEVVTQGELRRASRNAKESVEKNININYYMADAIGAQAPEKQQRKRDLDRRYRHLFEVQHTGGSGGGGAGGGGGGESGDTTAGALGDISPLRIDDDIAFDSVGGLPEHIVTLREMVLLPLLYPELLQQLNLRPPRGVLFVGPPGTGKTLMARALANEGSRFSGQKITFFMRKGADILSKWVGESERQLKLLFEEAKRQQPSIIFFDEIDGLAPTRHTKTEQTQAALVATLLALLDGMEDRGQVVVIGATNRPDTLDPALRRPGRFDRELLFPSPDAAARRHILNILTQTLLPVTHPRREEILTSLVAHTEGYSGADLKAVCTEAGLNRLRSAFPQLYTTSKRLRLPTTLTAGLHSATAGTDAAAAATASPGPLEVRSEDFFSAVQRVQPSLRRGGAEVRSLASLEEHQEVLYRSVRDDVLQRMAAVWPTVARALRREQRDCTNLVAAVRELTSFPVPYPRGPLLVFLSAADVPVLRRGSQLTAQDAAACQKNGSAETPSRATSRSARDGRAVAQATLLHTSLALLKGLPSFQSLTVHLPHIQVSFLELPFAAGGSGGAGAGAGGSAALFSDVFASGHIYELVQVVQRSSPCAVVLRGAAEWLDMHGLPPGATRIPSDEESAETEGHDDADRVVYDAETYERREGSMKALHYYLNLLAETEALLVVPCEDPRTRDAFLGVSREMSRERPRSSEQSTRSGSRVSKASSKASAVVSTATSLPLHPRFTLLDVQVPSRPCATAVESFVVHVYHLVSLSLAVALRVRPTATDTEAGDSVEAHLPGGAPVTSVPLSRARQEADRQRDLVLWRRVEYRRLQLRHVLLKWVTQYVNSGKYKLLLSPDLDLTPSHDLYKAWQRHTKGRRIGLEDVVEKLENESYTCLSQYHDDIDQITRNVRTFFTSRSGQDQRYRLKALELKETTVLSLYRINRGVVRFCEMHKDLQEPPVTPGATDRVGSGRETSEGDLAHGAGGDASGSTGRTSQKDPFAFSQRPPAPRKKSNRPRYFGQRRRRRRPAPTAVAETPASRADEDAAEATNDEDDEANHNGNDDAVVEEEKEEDGDGDVEQTSPFSPTQAPTDTLIQWATVRLRGLPYHVLLEVFRYVMMALEVQTQRIQAATSPTTADLATTTPRRPAASSSTREAEQWMAPPATLTTFTPLAAPPPPGLVSAGAHASPAARDPNAKTTTATGHQFNHNQKDGGDRTDRPSRLSTPTSSPALVASRTPSDRAETPRKAAALEASEGPAPAAFLDATEQTERAYITEFFQHSLIAAIANCHCDEFRA